MHAQERQHDAFGGSTSRQRDRRWPSRSGPPSGPREQQVRDLAHVTSNDDRRGLGCTGRRGTVRAMASVPAPRPRHQAGQSGSWGPGARASRTAASWLDRRLDLTSVWSTRRRSMMFSHQLRRSSSIEPEPCSKGSVPNGTATLNDGRPRARKRARRDADDGERAFDRHGTPQHVRVSSGPLPIGVADDRDGPVSTAATTGRRRRCPAHDRSDAEQLTKPPLTNTPCSRRFEVPTRTPISSRAQAPRRRTDWPATSPVRSGSPDVTVQHRRRSA